MNIKSLLLSLSIILSATACVNASHTALEANAFSIKAKTNVADDALVILSRITDSKLDIKDSTYVKKGAFTFEGEAEGESSLYFITFNTTSPPGIPLVLESGAKVTMNITQNGTIYGVNMQGGKYNKEMLNLYNTYTGFETKMAAFNKEVEAIDPASATEELRASTTQRYNALILERSKNIENFIRNEKATPATYFAVKYLFNKPEPKLIVLASDKMSETLPESSYTKNLQALAKQLGPTITGALAPDINLATPDGGTLALSSLRGKVVLIDFWASWCGPCRRENPAVKAIYDKYKDKGFEIYGVSLDNNATQWKAAIAKDKLTWKHVSDLKGWKSSASQLYGVRSIPATFLLDKEGRIYKSGFRSHELEGLLQQLLD